MNTIKTTLLLVIAFFLGYLASNVATTSAHGGDEDLIHACVRNNGSIRIVEANVNCDHNETPLDWRIQGEPSPTETSNFICIHCTARDLLYRLDRQTLVDLDLDTAFLNYGYYPGQDMSGSSFVRAVLYQFSAEYADLSNSDFSYANLRSTVFYGANLTNSNFTGADLYLTSFREANLTGADFTDALWNYTWCPDGTNSDDNGGTCIGHLTP